MSKLWDDEVEAVAADIKAQGIRLAQSATRSASILDRFKAFMSSGAQTPYAEQTRLIFLQKDLTADVTRPRQMNGTIRPPSALSDRWRKELGYDSSFRGGMWGMVISPFLAAPEELAFGDAKFREKETQPFFLGEPFPATWIEAPGDMLFAIKANSKDSLMVIDKDQKVQQVLDPQSEDKKELIPVRAIWLWRSTDEMYTVVMLGDKDYRLATVISEGPQGDPSFYGDSAIHWFIFELFQKLAKHGQLGHERVNERFKAGSGKGKIVVRVKDVIHIRARQKTSGRSTVEGRTIEWSHRWEVMGHWRKVNGIGKDDRGRYHVQGLTWVMPHTKGPEEKELVKKTRVYLGPKESA